MIEQITEALKSGNYSCVIAKEGEIREFKQRGIMDLYDLLINEPGYLKDSMIADKVVGKAAAALMVKGEVRRLHALTISEPAVKLLENNGVKVTFDCEVPHIINRDKTGMCPMEQATREVWDIGVIYEQVDGFVKRIRGSVVMLLMFLFASVLTAQGQDGMGVDSVLLREVVVTGTRSETDVRHLPMTVSVINRDKIEKRYEQSLLPVMTEMVPGFFATSRGVMGYGVSTGAAGGMSMRGIGGSPSTGMLVLIDGRPQYMGLMGHPIADAYQGMLAEKVEVVRGPASVLYGGNAMGGVINILTREAKEDHSHGNLRVGYGSYNTLTTEAMASINKKRFSALVTGSYNRTDGHRDRMGFEQYGGYAKVGYRFSRVWSVLADVNVTHYNASNPGTEARPLFDNDSRITRGMSSFSIENRSINSSGALKGYYNFGKHDIDDGYNEGGTPRAYHFNSKDKMAGITWYQSAGLFAGNRVTLGADYTRFGGKAWNAFHAGDDVELAKETESEYAAYVDVRQQLWTWLTVNAGVRYNYHSLTGGEWIPQVGASIHAMHNGELKLLASKGFRNPTIRELYMFPPQNANLQPECLWNYEISWSQRLEDYGITYGANIYYIKGKNIIQTMPVDGKPLNVNTGEIENSGVEVFASYDIASWLQLSANYSRLHMENPVIAAPEYKFYGEVALHKGRWQLTAGTQFIKGLYTSLNPESKEEFVLLNMRGSCRLTKGLELYVRGENLLNQKYEINSGFPMPGATVFGGINIVI